MRVYISVDMEGVCGVVHADQTSFQGKDYEIARKQMTREASAAACAAFEAGALEVVVNDSHGDMRNLLIEEMDERIRFITGSGKNLGMVEGIDRGFDLAFFIGYHSAGGTRGGIISHTMASSIVVEATVNGRALGETGLNALVAGHFGVPVGLVTGDEQTVREAKALLGNIETVSVKEGITRNAALTLHPNVAVRLIGEASTRAVKRKAEFKPLVLGKPLILGVRLVSPLMADFAQVIPGLVRKDGVNVEYIAPNALELYRMLELIITVSTSALPTKR